MFLFKLCKSLSYLIECFFNILTVLFFSSSVNPVKEPTISLIPFLLLNLFQYISTNFI